MKVQLFALVPAETAPDSNTGVPELSRGHLGHQPAQPPALCARWAVSTLGGRRGGRMVLGQGTHTLNTYSNHEDFLLFDSPLPPPPTQVTTSGQFVFPLDSHHKKPYEVLVLGRYRSTADNPTRCNTFDLSVPLHTV